MSDLDDDTEITEMHTPRVDLVSKAANGTRFFLAKSATSDDPSIFSADDVLALAKAQEGDMTDTTDEPLAKDAGDKIDPTVDTSKVDAAGDPNDPTSAAWEAVDAANAQTAIELAVALKRNITAAIEREATEVAVGGDPDDADNVWTLQGASDAVDCIVAALAPFAVSEAPRRRTGRPTTRPSSSSPAGSCPASTRAASGRRSRCSRTSSAASPPPSRTSRRPTPRSRS